MDDLRQIFLNLFRDTRGSSQFTAVESHDIQVIFGCLNFRLSLPKNSSFQKVYDTIQSEEFDDLLELDETISDFSEGLIKFKPTYKYEKGTSRYDPSTLPSWTDRIFTNRKADI